MHAEIELAREIHGVLVPVVDRRTERFELYGVSVPSSEVGGDLVDMVETERSWVGYIADVTGHGVASGLLMGMTKSAIWTRLLANDGLDTLLGDVNRVLFRLSKPNMFVTFAALRHDGSDRLEYSLAGHLPILHYRKRPGIVDELSIAQVPLGLFEHQPFVQASVSFEPGDLFALVTDGLTEVFDANDQEFGLDRLKDAIRQSGAQPLRVVADTVMQQTRAHGPQLDDQTILLIRAL